MASTDFDASGISEASEANIRYIAKNCKFLTNLSIINKLHVIVCIALKPHFFLVMCLIHCRHHACLMACIPGLPGQ